MVQHLRTLFTQFPLLGGFLLLCVVGILVAWVMVGLRKFLTQFLLPGIREFLLLCVVGILVAWVVVGLLQLEYVENIDRYVVDILMRHAAQQELTNDELKFLFINVGEKSCNEWIKDDQSSCTLGWATPRKRLAEIICNITEYSKNGSAPRFVVIDIELSPQARGDGSDPKANPCLAKQNAADKTPDLTLHGEVLRLLTTDPSVPLIAVRPIVINPDGPHRVTASRSILDPDFHGESHAPETYRNLWFASPIIQPDTDGVVRSVHECDTIFNENTCGNQPIAGIGLLGALLAHGKEAGQFGGSKPDTIRPRPDHCESKLRDADLCTSLVSEVNKQEFGRHSNNEENKTNGWVTRRIKFSRPFEQKKEDCASTSGSVLRDVETVEAYCFLEGNYSSLIKDRIVVLGGSYLASGDLRVTPLGDPRMPGAMVHVNAIRALSKGSIIEEAKFGDWSFWEVKLLLIGLAALSGAVFHVLSCHTTWGVAVCLTVLLITAVAGFGMGVAEWPGWESLETAMSLAVGVCIGAWAFRTGVSKVRAWGVVMAGVALVVAHGVASGWSLATLVHQISVIAVCAALGLAVCIYSFLGRRIVVSLLGLAIAAIAVVKAGPDISATGLTAAIGLAAAMCSGALGVAVFIGALGPEILVFMTGAVVTAMVVLGMGSSLTFGKLVAGTVIGTFVPALAVAAEGLCGVLHEIRGRAPHRFFDTQPSFPTGRSPNEPTSPRPSISSAGTLQ